MSMKNSNDTIENQTRDLLDSGYSLAKLNIRLNGLRLLSFRYPNSTIRYLHRHFLLSADPVLFFGRCVGRITELEVTSSARRLPFIAFR
jgi:hypothetical protein